MGGESVELRPVSEPDLEMFRRFSVVPGLIGLDWAGFRDVRVHERRLAADGYLGDDDGRLIVESSLDGPVGFVSYRAGLYSGLARYWEIGIALLPDYRGRGIGWRAQTLLSEYLFAHTPAQRIQAATHAENIAEQRSLEKAGFRLDGVIRAAEFREGRWCDGYLYSLLRDDPPPTVR